MDQKKNKGNNIFSICNGILLYGDRVVIPAVLTKILKDFYIGHPIISRMKALERYSVDKEIENVVKTCKICELADKAPPVKFNTWSKTDKSWSSLHIDKEAGSFSI